MSKKILIVEDEMINAILLKKILIKQGFQITVANNGEEARHLLEREQFDAVLTDWMMPHMDGIELIRFIRANIRPTPLIIMITALVSETAKKYALESGADEFIAKPIDTDDIVVRVNDGLKKIEQAKEQSKEKAKLNKKDIEQINEANPPFPAVAIASSTGGPPVLLEIFKNLPSNTKAAFFIVQHGPIWMLETFAQRLKKETEFDVLLGEDNLTIEEGKIYVAPGDKHMIIDADTFKIKLDDGPKENFVKPAADPLFRSVAKAFGRYTVAVVTTGLGKDGTQGLYYISKVKGSIIIQDPATATAPSMPQSAIDTGLNHRKVELKELAKAISEAVFPLSASIKIKNR